MIHRIKLVFILLFSVFSFIYTQDNINENTTNNLDTNEVFNSTNSIIEVDIKKALEIAYENSKALKEAEYDLKIAQVQKDRTFADLVVPSLTIGGTVGYGSTREIGFGLESSPDSYSGNIELSKTLFTGLRNWNNNKAQAVNLELAYEIYDEALEDVNIDTQLGFYNTLLIQENYRVFLRSQDALSNRMHFTYVEYLNGQTSDYEYLNAKVQYENTKPNLINLSNDFQSQKLAFLRSIGVTNEVEDIALIGNLYSATNISLPDMSYEQMLNIIMANNIDLITMEKNIEILEYQRRIANSFYYPNIHASVNGNVTYTDIIVGNINPALEREWEPGFGINLTLSYSLDSLFPFSSASKQAEEIKLNSQKLAVTYDALRDQIEVFSRDLIATSRSQKAALLSQAENVETAEYAYSIAERQYRAGLISQLEVNDAEVTYLNAQTAFIQTIFEYYTSTLQLMQLLDII